MSAGRDVSPYTPSQNDSRVFTGETTGHNPSFISTGGEAGAGDASKQTVTVVRVCVAVRHNYIYVFLGRCMSGYTLLMVVIRC